MNVAALLGMFLAMVAHVSGQRCGEFETQLCM